MLLAELEAFYSRPIAPTRRLALGSCVLPVTPPPGFGGVLLGGIVARFAPLLDEDVGPDLEHLVIELERGQRIAQPRLRHRLQRDRVGLQPCRHRLVGEGEQVRFELDEERGTPAQHVLCAMYAAGGVPLESRHAVMHAVRRGLAWRGAIDDRLVSYLSGSTAGSTVSVLGDPVRWALDLLDLRDLDDLESTDDPLPPRRVVQRAFREALRHAHPDHGAADVGAADRIADLSEARRILLGSGS
jgi:hypothetical protein